MGRPSPGKLVQLTQTGGISAISGPVPAVTNASGMIEFTAVDTNNETITYSAVDVTDGNLPFPETAVVTFDSAPEAGCSNTDRGRAGIRRDAIRHRNPGTELLLWGHQFCRMSGRVGTSVRFERKSVRQRLV